MNVLNYIVWSLGYIHISAKEEIIWIKACFVKKEPKILERENLSRLVHIYV